jgi:hypothetical protein
MPAPETAATPVRVAGAIVVAAFASALGGVVLGEYQFEGLMPYGAGLLFGLVVGELVVTVGHSRTLPLAVVSAALVAAGLGWAAWISSGEGLRPFPTLGWVAMGIGALATAGRVGEWRRRRAPAAG